ncbi:MAG: type I methionyl aminopeptidase [Pseudomonadota bacterium]|nr:type I methionyl aminopeptidase [Pseudomonadota bacterium]
MILIKEDWELGVMRTAGRKLAEVVAGLRERVLVGASTLDIDRMTEDAILAAGAKPAFKGYKVGRAVFPATICVSINEQVVHGIPSKRRLQEGDLVSLDFGLVYGGYYADTAFSMAMPPVDEQTALLLDTTEKSLYEAVARARVNNRIGDIGHTVQSYCESRGLGVVTQFVGHGIGRKLHEEPSVPNFGKAGTGPLLKAGMVLALEPMITLGSPRTRILKDEWTVVTEDGSRAAHFEHTVAITPSGPEILTSLDPSPHIR